MPVSNSSAPVPLDQDTPLPTGLNTTFLACVNTTIGASVPLMDVEKHGLSSGTIGLIVFFSIVGAKMIAWLIYSLYRRYHRVERTLRFVGTIPFSSRLIRLICIFRDTQGMGYAMPEGVKPVKGSRWLSNLPFLQRFRYRSVPKSQAEEYEDQDDHDFQDIPSRMGRKSISEVSSAEPPAYSKEAYDKPLDGTKETAQHKMPKDDASNHAAQTEHTHNDEKIDDTPTSPISHASV